MVTRSLRWQSVHSAASLLVVATTLLPGCVPGHAAFLRVPIVLEPLDPGGLVRVTAAYAEIRQQMPDFDPDTAAYYLRGRTPLPFHRHDRDGDGTEDAVVVVLEVRAGGDNSLVIVCPGPAVTAKSAVPTATTSGARHRQLRLDFTKARR